MRPSILIMIAMILVAPQVRARDCVPIDDTSQELQELVATANLHALGSDRLSSEVIYAVSCSDDKAKFVGVRYGDHEIGDRYRLYRLVHCKKRLPKDAKCAAQEKMDVFHPGISHPVTVTGTDSLAEILAVLDFFISFVSSEGERLRPALTDIDRIESVEKRGLVYDIKVPTGRCTSDSFSVKQLPNGNYQLADTGSYSC